MLPVSAVIVVLGVRAGGRRLERDPRKVVAQLGV